MPEAGEVPVPPPADEPLGEKLVSLCVSSLLLSYLAGVGLLLLEGVRWLLRGSTG